ncbi:MAG: Asp-tRNA(Asn)/Glu-tRNA(Gln) amidotransferase subunit GatB [Candidatus Improbicoccus pseudotrichonymphae]|uniref:Aspartyl/glutamyl-tRNA(Asn/Gln) amidotransferase subunit B n=1 Tax=Candidatus Improbicoccus pseudotrichonymphae TaxID=3033792 RepID=A0AA48HXY0_9FIRM|nr:MAG: Asp-tRNA(Asn)/Glu-tRNA(Gln) amidotransferase subunit GatB [Candidatus Improbicoccus pseudotrichonymphae]
MNFKLTCGLETHIELSSRTKIFCACSTEFGKEPNTSCCPVCLGLPGSLPVLNKQVIKFVVMLGLVLNCKINLNSRLERKNYIYPDLPKGYQISQFLSPICIGGFVSLSNGKKIRLNHIHIEEDAGKIIKKDNSIMIDYNRSGVPLVEIVSEPDIENPEEAKEYIEKLQKIVKDLKISDGRMQEGSIRCDVNVSVRKKNSSELGTRVEIKNMNSIKFIVSAICYEYERQVKILSENIGEIQHETRRFNEEKNITESMREKEKYLDYRYFNEPDTKEIALDNEFVEKIRSEIPELFDSKLARYKKMGLSDKNAELIAKYVKISDFFDETLKKFSDVNLVCNLITGSIFSFLETENKKENFEIPFNSSEFCDFLNLITQKKLNLTSARNILIKSLNSNTGLKELCEEFSKNRVDFDLNKICQEVVVSNKKAVSDYKKGKEKAIQSLLGGVMKSTKGLANLEEAKKIILNIINSK